MTTFRCPFCKAEMDVDPEEAYRHMRVDHVMVERIRVEHPEWQEKGGGCPRCMEEFRKGVPQAFEPAPRNGGGA